LRPADLETKKFANRFIEMVFRSYKYTVSLKPINFLPYYWTSNTSQLQRHWLCASAYVC